MLSRFLATLLLSLLICGTLHARPVAVWNYQMLVEQSDVVLIGKVVTSKAVDEKLNHPSFGEMMEGRRTTFQVQGVCKGKAEGETIDVVHFLVKPGRLVPNGPSPAFFRDKGRRLTIEAVDGLKEKQERLEEPPEYLLFLKVRKDGKFEPVSGQVDSHWSARKIAPTD